MLRPRISPCLLVHNKGLVKSVKFTDYKYVGDPINAVKIFNEKEVDELIILDIDATVNGTLPDMELIKNISNESRMPLCYGGGVKTVEQARAIVAAGVEKVAISSAAIQNPSLIPAMAKAIGLQSVVVVLDVAKKGFFKKWEIVTHNAKKATGKSLIETLRFLQTTGVGEIVINNVDRDGQMNGYDMDLAKLVRDCVTIPITFLGGANNLQNMEELINTVGVCGASAGSLFVFKGVYKAVLINYPDWMEKQKIYGKHI
jgi:imidazole glycerol-phosphate synthase subunit HisF